MELKLRRIINEWNPLEIFPLIESEYDYEISRVLLEVENKSILDEKLGSIIYKIFKDSFSTQFDKTIGDCIEVAKIILNND